jgi:hypothetical protein
VDGDQLVVSERAMGRGMGWNREEYG